MKIQIRSGMFETNSSSVHSFCAPKEFDIADEKDFDISLKTISSCVEIIPGRYDWDDCFYKDLVEKLTYFLTAALYATDDICKRLEEAGFDDELITLDILAPLLIYKWHECFTGRFAKYVDISKIAIPLYVIGEADYGIDHGNEIENMDNDQIINIILNKNAYIMTSNDNGGMVYDDGDTQAMIEKDVIFQKGN